MIGPQVYSSLDDEGTLRRLFILFLKALCTLQDSTWQNVIITFRFSQLLKALDGIDGNPLSSLILITHALFYKQDVKRMGCFPKSCQRNCEMPTWYDVVVQEQVNLCRMRLNVQIYSFNCLFLFTSTRGMRCRLLDHHHTTTSSSSPPLSTYELEPVNIKLHAKNRSAPFQSLSHTEVVNSKTTPPGRLLLLLLLLRLPLPKYTRIHLGKQNT